MPPRTREKIASSTRRRGCFSGRPPRPPVLPGGGSSGSSRFQCSSVIEGGGYTPHAGRSAAPRWAGHDRHEQTDETDIRAPGEAGRCRNHPPYQELVTSPGCPARATAPVMRRVLSPACRVPARACGRPGAGGSFHYPSVMAVLAPEREEPAPQPPRPPSASRRWPVPRPRRDTISSLPDDGRLSWVLTAILVVASLAVRLWGISYPKDLLFDEAYYPPEAHELLTWGFKYNRGYSFIVHPPLGKWFIAAGEQLFGYNSFGWRFPSAVAGAVGVVVLFRVTRRLTGSTLLGTVAGLLFALDGFSFVLSRVGLLDVFLQTLVL